MTAINVNLADGFASNIASGLDDHLMNIENILGGAGDDELVGDSADNIIAGNGGNDSLRGGLGNDTYVYNDGWGSDQIFEDEDAGEDTITFNGNDIVGIDAVLTAIQFHLYDDGLFVTDSTNDTTYAGTAIENLVGGLGDDRFLFHDSGAVAGVVDGGAGTDTLDFSDRAAVSHVYLTDYGDIDVSTDMSIPTARTSPTSTKPLAARFRATRSPAWMRPAPLASTAKAEPAR